MEKSISIGEEAGLTEKKVDVVENPDLENPKPEGEIIDTEKTELPPGDEGQKKKEEPSEPKLDGLEKIFIEDVKSLNETFDLPENFSELSETEKYKFMKEQILENTQKQQTSDDPFIDEYLEAKKNGMGVDEFIQKRNILNTIKQMPDDQFLFNYYQNKNGKTEENPNGWNDEDINRYIEELKANPIKLKNEADRYRDEIYGEIKQESEQYKTKISEQIKDQSIKMNETVVKESVDKLFAEMAELKDIGGIPHTPEDQTAFKQMFLDVVSINPETGYSRAKELFSDDKVLYQTLYLYSKIKDGENSLKGFLSKFKEEYKQQILDKTRLAPRKEGGRYDLSSIPEPGDFV